MKKYISTIFAAAVAVAPAMAEEAETVPFSTAITALPTTQTFLSANYAVGSADVTATNVNAFMGDNSVSKTSNGWYSGLQANTIIPQNQETVNGFTNKESGLTFNILTRRTDHLSTYGALVLNVGVLKAAAVEGVSNVASVDTLTGSFVVGNIPTAISPANFSAWTYDTSASSATQAGTTTTLTSGQTVNFTVSLAGLEDADNICLIWGATPDTAGWSNYQIKDLKVAASGTRTVPEPATATLSLLALAGLAARRRRK